MVVLSLSDLSLEVYLENVKGKLLSIINIFRMAKIKVGTAKILTSKFLLMSSRVDERQILPNRKPPGETLSGSLKIESQIVF